MVFVEHSSRNVWIKSEKSQANDVLCFQECSNIPVNDENTHFYRIREEGGSSSVHLRTGAIT